jgi:hypothetical protein
MLVVMGAAGMVGGAAVRVIGARGDPVLVDMVAVLVVQVTIVQVVGMSFVGHAPVAAPRGVGVGSVALVLGAAHQ